MHEREFQALKLTFMHVSILPYHNFLFKKKQFIKYLIFNQNMAREDLRRA